MPPNETAETPHEYEVRLTEPAEMEMEAHHTRFEKTLDYLSPGVEARPDDVLGSRGARRLALCSGPRFSPAPAAAGSGLGVSLLSRPLPRF